MWWLAWFAPGLLLALALRTDGWTSRGLVALAALIGVTANAPYFLKVMPLVPVIIVMLLQTLLWLFVVGTTRRVVKAFDSGWTVLALPGDLGGRRYAARAFHARRQLGQPRVHAGGCSSRRAARLGVRRGRRAVRADAGELRAGPRAASRPAHAGRAAGLLGGGRRVRRHRRCFGWWRLQAPEAGKSTQFGIVSIDDFLLGPDSDQSREVWLQYDAQVTALAAGGASIVLLPEKIDVLPAADAEARKAHLAKLAAANHVWLVAGLGVDNGKERRNEAWWFAPDGRLATNYLKHFMAPPEREFVSGQRISGEFHRRRELRRRHLQGHALREPRPGIRCA